MFGLRTQTSFLLLYDAAVTKEFTDNLCSLNMPSLSSTEVCMELTVPYEVDKFMANKLSQVSTLYTLVLVSFYNG